jgi:cystathionine gamma-synthase
MLTYNGRFFIDLGIERFAQAIVAEYGKEGERALLFPTCAVASRCVDFFKIQDITLSPREVRLVHLIPNTSKVEVSNTRVLGSICAVIFPAAKFPIGKAFWQHTGEGVSSRRAEYHYQAYESGLLVEKRVMSVVSNGSQRLSKGPRRYQKSESTKSHTLLSSADTNSSSPAVSEGREYAQYVEERFGRNLGLTFVNNAKLAIRRRIAGTLTANVELEDALNKTIDSQQIRGVSEFSEKDVYLYPCGMNSIYNTHRVLLEARGPAESICFGLVLMLLSACSHAVAHGMQIQLCRYSESPSEIRAWLFILWQRIRRRPRRPREASTGWSTVPSTLHRIPWQPASKVAELTAHSCISG